MSKVVLSLVPRLSVTLHLVKCSLHESHLPQLVRIDHTIDLALDLGKNELVLSHHIKRLRLQDLLLVVSNDAFVSSLTSLALLLQLEGVFAHLVIRVPALSNMITQLLMRHPHNLFFHYYCLLLSLPYYIEL